MELHEDDIKKLNINVLNKDPLIFSIDNFLSIDDCNHMIEIIKPNLKDALVSSNKGGIKSKGRTGSNCWIKKNHDNITFKIVKNISKLINIPVENSENFQAIYYNINEKYNSHFDAYEKNDSEKCKRCLKYGGQRILTALIYLNDVEKGGGTNFPKLNLTCKAEQGKLLIFNNCFNNTTNVHNNSLHGGLAVESGEKYAINLWFREMDVKKLYDFPFLHI
jgi:prolyl 4-hydroxylase